MALKKAVNLFKKNKGILRTADALKLGIHASTLYKMREEGTIEALDRGLYRLTELPYPEEFDLVTAALTIPKGVVCLLSALAFHNLTSQIPSHIDVALKKGSRRPKLKYPPTRVFWFSEKDFQTEVEEHVFDGFPVKIYSQEKTIVDCFKFRTKIGLNVAIEAFKIYWASTNKNLDKIMELAAICRVYNVMKPYIEGIINE